MTTYTKIIQSMNCLKQEQSMTDVVYQINWSLVGTSTDGFVASCVMITDVPAPTSSFTPYDQLTEAQVMSWVNQYTTTQSLDEATAIIESNLQSIANTTSPALPWSS